MHQAASVAPGGVGYILVFLVLLGAIGVCLQFTDVSFLLGWNPDSANEARVGVFAVAALLYSLVFAHFLRTLRSDEVDFWYYSLAMFGVVMLFLDSSSDRAVVIALSEREGSRAALNQTSTQWDRLRTIQMELATAVGNPREVFDRIRRGALSPESIRARDARVETCHAYNADLAKRQFEQRLRDQLPKPYRGPAGTDIGAPKRLDDPRLLQPRDCDDILREWTEVSRTVKEATHPVQLRPLARGTWLKSIAGTGLNLRILTFEELIGYLERAWDLESAGSLLDPEIEALEAKRDELRVKVDAPITRPDPRLTWTGTARQFVWPYVLLAALALKLARRDYLTSVLR
jgi:hypothetical protein